MPLKSTSFFGSYKLRYDWNAHEEMQEALGTPSFAEFGAKVASMGPKTMRVLIWAGLLHENPGLNLEDVKDILNEYLEEHTAEELAEVLTKALSESSVLGGDKGEAKEKKRVIPEP